jgi:hypothetical protein
MRKLVLIFLLLLLRAGSIIAQNNCVANLQWNYNNYALAQSAFFKLRNGNFSKLPLLVPHRAVKRLSLHAEDDLAIRELNVRSYVNLRFLEMSTYSKTGGSYEADGRFYFPDRIHFSGGTHYMPMQWPEGMHRLKKLQYIRYDIPCSEDDCESAVLMTWPKHLFQNNDLRWIESSQLVLTYIPESICSLQNLEILSIFSYQEMPFIPINLFRCQRLSYLNLPAHEQRPEFLLIKELMPAEQQLYIYYTDGSPIDVFPLDSTGYIFNVNSTKPLKPITLSRDVKLYSADQKQLLISGRIENGWPEGYWQVWHTNGTKAQERHYLHGRETGIWQAWDTTGRIIALYVFSDSGHIETSYKYYSDYTDATYKHITSHDNNGMPCGQWKTSIEKRYPGAVLTESIDQNYKEGLLDGVSTATVPENDGSKRISYLMKRGKIVRILESVSVK